MRAILLVAVVGVAACGQQSNAYPPQYELNFMQACRAQGAPVEFCACSWEKIERQVPAQDFAAFELLSESEQSAHPLNEEIRRFADECRAEAADAADPPPSP